MTVMDKQCVNGMEYCIVETIGSTALFIGTGKYFYLFVCLKGFLKL